MKPQPLPDPANLPLRDVHLPETVSWWPPAPGWWWLLAALLVLSAAMLWQWHRWRQRRVLRRLLHELEQLQQSCHQQQHASDCVQQLSVLLRRAMLSFFPRHDVASLTGDDWLRFLDRHGNSSGYLDGVGRLLTEAPYRATDDIDARQMGALFRLARQTLQQAFRYRRRK